MKGVIDDLGLVIQTLEERFTRDRFYIHCDAALFGMMLPFMKGMSNNSIKAFALIKLCVCLLSIFFVHLTLRDLNSLVGPHFTGTKG